MLKQWSVFVLFIFGSLCLQSSGDNSNNYFWKTDNNLDSIYFNRYLNLQGNKPDYRIFLLAMRGYDKLKSSQLLSDKNIISIIDYRLSSNKERLWVIDLNTNRVLYNVLVAHGKNTGEEYAVQFSNNQRSWQSSLGFFITGDKYLGKHGLSLRLEGIEKGINDNARQRAIVMHGANYVSHAFIEKNGRLGRSFGCPAVSYPVHKEIIELIARQTCLFTYAHPEYIAQSEILAAP
ncbi:MAG: hypothetical protein GVY19_02325 [Bacteroidetes bacterium]|nr:hypothetical protein [Bacteroidota bacterium]